MEQLPIQKRSRTKLTLAYEIAVVAGVVLFVALVIFQSLKGNGESERDLAQRVIWQCWKARLEGVKAEGGAQGHKQSCEKMERGFKEAYGSSRG